MLQQTDIAKEKLLPLIIRFSIPAVLSLVFTTVYSIIDRIYLGNYTGNTALAALSICFPLTLMIVAIGLTCSAGGATLFRLYSCREQHTKANQSFCITFILTVVFELLLMVIVLVFDRKILTIFGVTSSTYLLALRYFKIVAIGAVFQGLTFVFCDFIRVSGKPMLAISLSGAGALINIILDTVFIAVFHWGVTGAAWATVIGQVVSALIGAYILFSGKTLVKVEKKSFNLDRRMTGNILYNGTIFWVIQISMGILIVLYNGSLGEYGGERAISMYAIISSIMLFLVMLVSGIGQGIQPLIEKAYGRSNVKEIKKIFIVACGYTVSILLVIWAVIQLLPAFIIELFDGNEELMTMGVSALRTSFILAPVIGFIMFTVMFFQAIGKQMFSFMIIFVKHIIAIVPFIYILPMYFGKMGIFWAEAIADLITLVIAVSYIIREFRELSDKEKSLKEAFLE